MLTASLLRPVHFRGKARLLHKLCPHEGIRTANIFGYQMSLDLRNYIERSIYLHIFEPHESSLVRHHLKAGMTVIDIGANVGYYSLMAASIGCEVYAFEPSPYAVNKLRETIQRNGIENITVIESALGDSTEDALLYVSTHADRTTPSMVANDETVPTEIKATTLDAFLSANNIPHVDLLKIDVEGYEPNVIRGAHESLSAGRIKAILCEFNEHWLVKNHSSSNELFESLTSFGFVPRNSAFQKGSPLQNLLLVQ